MSMQGPTICARGCSCSTASSCRSCVTSSSVRAEVLLGVVIGASSCGPADGAALLVSDTLAGFCASSATQFEVCTRNYCITRLQWHLLHPSLRLAELWRAPCFCASAFSITCLTFRHMCHAAAASSAGLLSGCPETNHNISVCQLQPLGEMASVQAYPACDLVLQMALHASQMWSDAWGCCKLCF